jgi:hypothetical protein
LTSAASAILKGETVFIRLLTRLWKLGTGAEKTVVAPPIAERSLSAAPPTPVRASKQGRPLSPALTKAVELLAANPCITAAEVAASIGVTPSYGRTLMRRARSRVADAPTEPNLSGVQPTLADLHQRLAFAERDLAAVRAMPVHARASLNLNRRAEVLRLLGGGLAPECVADRLAIPQGEVEFIRKVDRLIASSV